MTGISTLCQSNFRRPYWVSIITPKMPPLIVSACCMSVMTSHSSVSRRGVPTSRFPSATLPPMPSKLPGPWVEVRVETEGGDEGGAPNPRGSSGHEHQPPPHPALREPGVRLGGLVQGVRLGHAERQHPLVDQCRQLGEPRP